MHQRPGEIRIRRIGARVLHQLDGHHGAERAHVAHTRKAHLQPLQARAHEAPDVLRAFQQLLLAHYREHRQPRGAAERGAGERAPQTARARRVHDVGLAGHG